MLLFRGVDMGTLFCNLWKRRKVTKRVCKKEMQHLCYPSEPKKGNCDQGPCPDPYQDWSSWGPCLQTCGNSTQFRSRLCKKLNQCEDAGPSLEVQACYQKNCTSEVTEWSAWGKCSVTCDNGTHTRHRHCLTEDTFPCKQELFQTRACPGKQKMNKKCEK